MKISTKGRYGLRAMLELGLKHGTGPVLMGDIAQNQNISRKYLHALLTSLRSAGLVRSVRGSKGGYTLARAPQDITLDELIVALEGSLSPVDCVEEAKICDSSGICVVREVWMELANLISDHLAKLSLADLVEKQHLRDSAKAQMYHI